MDMTVIRLIPAISASLARVADENPKTPAYASTVEAAFHVANGDMRMAQTCLIGALSMLGEGSFAIGTDVVREAMDATTGHSVQACTLRSILQVALKIADGVAPHKLAEALGTLHFSAGQVAKAALAAPRTARAAPSIAAPAIALPMAV